MKRSMSVFLGLLAVVGCSRREPAASVASRQIRQLVPDNASLVTAREVMEQHHFDCSVENYTNSQVINANDGELLGRTYLIEGQFEVVTNVCYLNCVARGSEIPCGQARFTFINQRKYTFLFVSTGFPKS